MNSSWGMIKVDPDFVLDSNNLTKVFDWSDLEGWIDYPIIGNSYWNKTRIDPANHRGHLAVRRKWKIIAIRRNDHTAWGIEEKE